MRIFILFLLFAGMSAQTAQAALPDSVADALQKAGIPQDHVSVIVQRVDTTAPLVSNQADQPLNPASTMKLLTTYAGLSLLGPAYRWHTDVYMDGTLTNGVLQGNLILKGYGDPAFMAEDLWRLLNNLRQMGIKDIHGDLLLDASYFSPNIVNSADFDGEAYRAYNALPNGLLLNLKASSFKFQAISFGGSPQVLITAEPNLPEIKVINRVQLKSGDCGEWKNKVSYQIEKTTVTFSGSYASSCAEKYMELSFLDDAHYTFSLFRAIWQQLGGRVQGDVKQITVPVNATKIAQADSPALADVIRRINKYSNNLMARQLFLTLGAEQLGTPAEPAKSDKAIRDWLASKSLIFNELVLENGAGLSRNERITARHMAALLLDAYTSPVMPELMSSLPILSVDGTVAKRLKDSPAVGRAHLKTGSLNGVSAISGYVLDGKGRYWVLVFMANDAQAAASKAAQDALIDWVYQQQ
jgi:D-alanyl-D-alanine carboxypeptidase/D-alanyl-D-alanine-endopeptidase (penicillin-binding protein 4)